jgi:hypothetical protein
LIEAADRLIEADDFDRPRWKWVPGWTEPQRSKKSVAKQDVEPRVLTPSEYKGSGKARISAVRGAGNEKPYAPTDAGMSPGWLKFVDVDAYEGLKQMGKPSGKVFQTGPYLMFRPDDPSQRVMFWAGVPEKLKPTSDRPEKVQDGDERVPAWRTYDELSLDQKRLMGWLDQRDRGQAKKPKEEPEEPGMGVRVRGFERPPVMAFDDDGNLVPAEPEVTGHMPGATPYVPGFGGGLPSQSARDMLAQADAAAEMDLNPQQMSLASLQRARDVVAKKYKLERMPDVKRLLHDIDDAISDREAGVPPSPKFTSRPQKKDEPPHPKGPKKKWGSNPDVTVFRKPKK